VAVPGAYKVRLTVGGWSQTRQFTLLPDPRVKTTPAGYQAQFDLLLKIRDRVSAANDAVRRIREVREELDGAATRARGLPGDATSVSRSWPTRSRAGSPRSRRRSIR